MCSNGKLVCLFVRLLFSEVVRNGHHSLATGQSGDSSWSATDRKSERRCVLKSSLSAVCCRLQCVSVSVCSAMRPTHSRCCCSCEGKKFFAALSVELFSLSKSKQHSGKRRGDALASELRPQLHCGTRRMRFAHANDTRGSVLPLAILLQFAAAVVAGYHLPSGACLRVRLPKRE